MPRPVETLIDSLRTTQQRLIQELRRTRENLRIDQQELIAIEAKLGRITALLDNLSNSLDIV